MSRNHARTKPVYRIKDAELDDVRQRFMVAVLAADGLGTFGARCPGSLSLYAGQLAGFIDETVALWEAEYRSGTLPVHDQPVPHQVTEG